MTQNELDKTHDLKDIDFKTDILIGKDAWCFDPRIWNQRGKDLPKEQGGNIDCWKECTIIDIKRNYVCCKTIDDPGHIHPICVTVKFHHDNYISKGHFSSSIRMLNYI